MTAPEPPQPVEPGPAGSSAVFDLAALLQQIGGTPPEPAPAAPAPPPEAEDVSRPAGDEPDAADEGPHFKNLGAFMEKYLAPIVERRLATGNIAGVPWCPQWWKHPEALSRFYALWRSWETLRVSDPGTGMSVWWRDHFDNHFAVLTGEYGPFGKCSPDRHENTAPLPVEPIPPEVLAELPDHDPTADETG